MLYRCSAAEKQIHQFSTNQGDPNRVAFFLLMKRRGSAEAIDAIRSIAAEMEARDADPPVFEARAFVVVSFVDDARSIFAAISNPST
jgi:hypothetical protein